MSAGKRLLVFPRDRNPYQRLLYAEMRALGWRVDYVGGLTPSRTLNLLLLPVELLVRGSGGPRPLLHLHWLFGFRLVGADRFPQLRRVARLWFRVVLRAARLRGLRIVWTAHNALPHEPIFDDDVSARRELVDAAEVVVAHSQWTLHELARLGVQAPRAVVVEHPPYVVARRPTAPAPASSPLQVSRRGRRELLYFGNIAAYKGVDDLLAAACDLSTEVPLRLTVTGRCQDAALAQRLRELAERCALPVTLRLDYLDDDELERLILAADGVVLPFRRVTTSGSAAMALTHARPLVLPTLPALSSLLPYTAVSYDPQRPGALHVALRRFAELPEGELAELRHRIENRPAPTWRAFAIEIDRQLAEVA